MTAPDTPMPENILQEWLIRINDIKLPPGEYEINGKIQTVTHTVRLVACIDTHLSELQAKLSAADELVRDMIFIRDSGDLADVHSLKYLAGKALVKYFANRDKQ